MSEKSSNSIVASLLNDAHEDSAIKDFEMARVNIISIIDTSKDAIASLSAIAEQSQHPRMYEVLAQLIEKTVNANKTLLDLQEKIRTIDQNKNNVGQIPSKITNNTLFVTTSQLSALLTDVAKENGGNIIDGESSEAEDQEE